jgi:hypothetical protein
MKEKKKKKGAMPRVVRNASSVGKHSTFVLPEHHARRNTRLSHQFRFRLQGAWQISFRLWQGCSIVCALRRQPDTVEKYLKEQVTEAEYEVSIRGLVLEKKKMQEAFSSLDWPTWGSNPRPSRY